MSVLESDTEKKVSEYAESIGYISLKINVVGQRGWPDHLYINRYGYHIWIEFKKKGKPLSKLQEHRIKQLREQDAEVHWADNYADARWILDDKIIVGRDFE